jgi:hypothetical protein
MGLQTQFSDASTVTDEGSPWPDRVGKGAIRQRSIGITCSFRLLSSRQHRLEVVKDR